MVYQTQFFLLLQGIVLSKGACTAKTTDKDTPSKEHMAVVSAYVLCILIGSCYVIAQLLRFVCLVLHILVHAC